jgi:hypothetical protein
MKEGCIDSAARRVVVVVVVVAEREAEDRKEFH